MEPHRNLSVLPSNAPSLPRGTNTRASQFEDPDDTKSSQICGNFNIGNECRVCSLRHICATCRREDHGSHACKTGILRISSGNVGSSNLEPSAVDLKAGLDEQCGLPESSFLIGAPLHSAQAALKIEKRKRRRGVDAFGRPPSDYRAELQSPRYIAYRRKQSQSHGNGSKEQVWPDRVEEAFQRAMRRYQRRGRKKEDLGGKKCGGNEFISDYIEKHTGVYRNRKQVSSHIQVLKAFLQDNPAWMSLVSAVEPEKEKRAGHTALFYDEATRRWEGSEFGNAASHHSRQPLHHLHPNAPPPPPSERHFPDVHQGPTIRQVKFAMTLCDAEYRPLHPYTSIQSEMGSAPKALADVNYWHVLYPQLALYCDQGYLDIPLFLFETNLSLMNDFPGCHKYLAIDLSVDFIQGTAFEDWQSLTRFYEENGNWVDLSKFYEKSQPENSARPQRENSPWDMLECSEVPESSDMRLKIPLKSRWWADAFARILHEKHKAQATKNSEVIKQKDVSARRYIGGISVMQELFATPRTHGSQRQRMAILLWKFSQSQSGGVATTSWRRLIPPVSPFQIQSPLTQRMKPPMTLDTALQDAVASHSVPVYADYHNSQPSIFTENCETLLTAPLSDGSSFTTTPTPEDRSFPPSMSTSFPPSVSNSNYAPHPSQESSFHSQEPAYASLESFDSQGSASQDSYITQDTMYHSQDSLYAPLYEYPPPLQIHHPNDRNLGATDHEFTGGEIQLSYVQQEESAVPYDDDAADEEPLIAPRANMISQHQLIHNLEQFDHNNENGILFDHGDAADEQHSELGITNWQTAATQPLMWANMRFQDVEYDEYSGEMMKQGQVVGGDRSIMERHGHAVGYEESSIEGRGHELEEVQEE